MTSVTESLLAEKTKEDSEGAVTKSLLSGQGLAGSGARPGDIVPEPTGDPVAKGDFSITDLFTGGERLTPRAEAATEITGVGGITATDQDFAAKLKITAGMLIAAEPGQQIDIIQSAIPEAKVSTDEFGSVFVNIGEDEFILNKPGASLQDFTQTVANILAFIPSAKFTTKGVESGGKFLASRGARAQATRGFAAGAGTSAALDVGAQALGAEEGIDPGRAALTGALEAAVPLAGGAIRAFRGRGVPIDVEPGTAARITEADAADVPIELFPAQKTGVLSQLETQSFVAGLPGGSQIAFRALEKQNKQAFDATLEFVNRIAPPTAAEGGAQRFRTAAQKAIEQAKTVRREKASPLFKGAFAEAAPSGPKFPETISAGPFSAATQPPIGKSGSTVFREVSPDNLRNLLVADRDGGALKNFFANEKEFALGQGFNKGVIIEARADFIAGERSFAKPGLRVPGSEIQEFESQFLSSGFINKIEIAPGVKLAPFERRIIGQLGLEKSTLPDGSIVYERIADAAALVDTSALITNLDDTAKKFPRGGEVHRALSRAKRFIEDAGGNLEKLHNAKTEIDQIISSRKDGGLGPTTQRQLLGVQEHLISEMEKASGLYAQARAEFKRLSPDVDALKEGVIGRTANVKDPQLKSLSRTIFDAAETDPTVIARVRKVIDAADPGAYDDLLRIEMGRRLGALKPTQSLVENAPGQLRRALFGNQAQRKALFAALRPPQRAIAQWLDTKLGRASLGRPGGSQTAARQEIKEEFKKGTVRALITFLGSPVRGLAKVGEEKAIIRNARAVAELIFDPSYERDVRSIIRQSTANTREGGQELLTLLAAVAGQELGDEE